MVERVDVLYNVRKVEGKFNGWSQHHLPITDQISRPQYHTPVKCNLEKNPFGTENNFWANYIYGVEEI